MKERVRKNNLLITCIYNIVFIIYNLDMSKNFKNLLKKNDISVSEISNELGLTPYSVYGYKAGRITPSFEIIKKMKVFFNRKGVAFDPFDYF